MNDQPDAVEQDGTPGWDAINAALAAVHPGQAPQHFGTALPHTLGGQDPLDGISVYWVEAPRPHWHYVTYGFSELYAKESDDATVSGFGFELTFRLAAQAGEGPDARPPGWPMSLLQNLARYVFGSGNGFEDGHHLDANGPIALETDTLLRHVAFIEDPQLPPRDTVHGRLAFLQLVGLTDGEMAAIKRWSTRGVLDVLAPAMPRWITDLHRADLLADLAWPRRRPEGSAREGASTGMLFIETLDWRQEQGAWVLVLGAGQVAGVRDLLPLRLRHGRPLLLASRERQWTFDAAQAQEEAVEADGDSARWSGPAACVEALLETVRAERGRYRAPGIALEIEVVPTLLRDARGEVIRVIG